MICPKNFSSSISQLCFFFLKTQKGWQCLIEVFYKLGDVFYGSGSLWSGQLAAMLFSIFATLRRWKLNTRKWLTAYLQACAENGGKAPPDVTMFLPWNLSERRRREFAEQPGST